ncbi:MAG: T9SS type A sorting domain-containing protein [Candidatus Kapabacteria bacterium]|nr:T9SS type A sorting domain-containing protein [Candidatus Kapabacteria bacterium]
MRSSRTFRRSITSTVIAALSLLLTGLTSTATGSIHAVHASVPKADSGGIFISPGEVIEDPADSATSFNLDIPTGLIELSAEQLALIGVRYDTATISYIEEGLKFNVRTTGIAISGSNGVTDKRTPRHVTLYKRGRNMASWKRMSTEGDVDELVGIRVRLFDAKAKPNHREAVVVIWCVPPIDVPVQQDRVQETGPPLGNADSVAPEEPTLTRTAIRPNPVAGSVAMLSVTVARPCNATVTIYDMLGGMVRLVAADTPLYAGTQDIPLENLHELSQGMYLVVVDAPASKERQVRRMLIER